MLTILLLLIAFVCFLLAAFGVASRINLMAAGLAAWVATQLLPALMALG